MQFTPIGALLAWISIGLLIPSALFPSPLILGVSTTLLLAVLLDGIIFHNQAGNSKGHIAIQTEAYEIDTEEGRNLTCETTITNKSQHKLHVARLVHTFPQGLEGGAYTSDLVIPQDGTRSIGVEIKPLYPGRFKIEKTALQLEGRLFKHTIEIATGSTIRVRPKLRLTREIIEAPTIAGTSTSTSRLAKGTDLAGIRPSIVLDDLRRIDWKATARMGKMMSREFYLEDERAIMLVVDSRVKATLGRRRKLWADFLVESERLLGSFRQSSSVGLSVYSERGIETRLSPEPGFSHRIRILDEISDLHPPESSQPLRLQVMPQIEARPEADSKARSVYMKQTLSRQVRSFFLTVAPFLDTITLRHRARVRREEGFSVLQEIGMVARPLLIIVITCDNSPLDGLREGARMAIASNHRIIIAVLSAFGTQKRMNNERDSCSSGMVVLKCPPSRLSSTLRQHVLHIADQRIRVNRITNGWQMRL